MSEDDEEYPLYGEEEVTATPPTSGHNSGDDDLDDLSIHDMFLLGRKMVLKDLLQAIQEGHATPQEKATLVKMLKDNGYVMGDPMADNSGKHEEESSQPLPSFEDPQYAS